MTPEQLRSLCLSFNASVEDFPFSPEVSVFKVCGKLFALSWMDAVPLKVNLKCDPDDAVRLRGEYPGVITPGYHMNKRHWNTVDLAAGLPERLVRELVEDSYDLVVAGLPRAERLRLDRP
ncbi:MmcQ/YjbR family DNA-binding protein [Streptomyces acidiscabies]|uniref:MmcQ-like protein n=1 Tax=Streptomyces acidiscabies TaxID=42234 RepID=A0A0L0JVV1_9ACTN|nr:MmcQ/YjbR family DNA-binding protein [Streptomyces acidiscabies]MBP5939720.1 MmcQ/YjbR family DNA-binding protein [Streptomyces sp. LBUM 1476]KND29648.1 MmcQ-like protein [Streptomyces acidiscabies]MBZ3910896.1 MmcQ/YjbR family DNA-binding protein [Streptomyces acidiscabies]MDX2959324.1 MmcQ/YjbR family DNA-binding protein [Streptomyces acidiscabies]MDX3017532.1 MmcQ/YjbR family DNA-binding protein [Streptomyces acidiscabies]